MPSLVGTLVPILLALHVVPSPHAGPRVSLSHHPLSGVPATVVHSGNHPAAADSVLYVLYETPRSSVVVTRTAKNPHILVFLAENSDPAQIVAGVHVARQFTSGKHRASGRYFRVDVQAPENASSHSAKVQRDAADLVTQLRNAPYREVAGYGRFRAFSTPVQREG